MTMNIWLFLSCLAVCSASLAAERTLAEAKALEKAAIVFGSGSMDSFIVFPADDIRDSIGADGVRAFAIVNVDASPVLSCLVIVAPSQAAFGFHCGRPGIGAEPGTGGSVWGYRIVEFNAMTTELGLSVDEAGAVEFLQMFVQVCWGLHVVDRSALAVHEKMMAKKIPDLDRWLVGVAATPTDGGWRFEMSFGNSVGFTYYARGFLATDGKIALDSVRQLSEGLPDF